ncbi:MAG: winged helix-turn-helix domain-containing protein [Urechidicola sp.]|nr:winged helix-turn-helix domain-containing protein [Urechidicola sp.]
MGKRKSYFIISLTILVFIVVSFTVFKTSKNGTSEKVKVSLRAVGHELLLSNQDSTSLVLPIVELNKGKFQLSFENKLSIAPSDLTTIIKQNINKASLPLYYLVEVKSCSSQEVVYSYEMKRAEEKSIIPCFGRVLERDCYLIEIHFINKGSSFSSSQIALIVFFALAFLFAVYFLYTSKSKEEKERSKSNYQSIGCFQFYPDQNKLVKEAVEINLSKKECELLSIFIENPNQIIKRDELTKRVWEDHGVIVGRSLDTYISKLRKKLIADASIKLTNIHGVGYKLEVKE